MTRQEEIIGLLAKLDISEAFLARRLKVSPQKMNYQLKKAVEMDFEYYLKAKEFLRSIKTEDMEPSQFKDALPVQSYPVLGYVYAGEPNMLNHEQVSEQAYFYYEKPTHHCFALRVNGDSMETTLRNGDIVLVDMDVQPKDGDLVAVKLKDGSQYIKRYKDMNYAFIQLISDNHKYGDRLVDKNDILACYKVVKGHVNF